MRSFSVCVRVISLIAFLFCAGAEMSFAESEVVWQKQEIIDSDYYFYAPPAEGGRILCSIYTPPKRVDQLDAVMFEIKSPTQAIEYTMRFRKDGTIEAKNNLLTIINHGSFDRTEVQGSDWFAERCLQYAPALPEPIKQILRRKYTDLK